MKNELTFFPKWAAGRPGYADRIREKFQEYHQQQGLRMTPQRNTILEVLLKADTHVTLDEIYRQVKKDGIGRVTVFRALKMLEEAKLVDKVTAYDGTHKYEVNYERPHHDHLICISCGSIEEIQWPEVERIQEKTCRKIGFKPTFHRHEIFGICRACQEKEGGIG